MNLRSLPAQLLSAFFWVAGLSWAALVFDAGYRPTKEQVPFLVMAVVLVTLGDVFEIDLRGGRSTPVSNAVVFALFVVLQDVPEVLVVVIPGFFLALVIQSRRFGWGPRFRSTSRRLATTMFARFIFVGLAAVLPSFPGQQGALLSVTVAMAISGFVYLLADTGMSAVFIAVAQGVPVRPIWRSQLANLIGLHAAFISVAALIGLAFDVLGEWAFVLFLLPLLAARHAFRRYASVHKTYQQTIRALSRAPELAGYAPQGHSSHIADLATALARRQGMSDNEVQEVEFAALLHDVGRFFFDDPGEVPESFAGTEAGARLAEASSTIVGRTDYLSKVAALIREQDKAFEEKPALGARIVKIANDYVELSREGPELSPLTAVHQLELQAGTQYDTRLVRSLRGILEFRGVI